MVVFVDSGLKPINETVLKFLCAENKGVNRLDCTPCSEKKAKGLS